MLVSRDPFAREELHKQRVRYGDSCAWCGRDEKSGVKLYRFYVETDGGRRHEDSKLFCSKSCRSSYHG